MGKRHATTSQQPVLFAPTPPHNGTRTSEAAAEAAKADAQSKSAIILAALRAAGRRGLTQAEITKQTGVIRATVCPRIADLGDRGLVKALAEERAISRHTSGMVFVAAEFVGDRPLADWPAQRRKVGELLTQALREIHELRGRLERLEGRVA